MAALESWEDGDDDDDWEVKDLVDDGAAVAAAPVAAAGDDGEEWMTKAAPAPAPAPAVVSAAADIEDRPLILVNFTALSKGRIHNRHDPHACNDPEAKSALAKDVAAAYERYANDASLIASGTVRPCGQRCWREALAVLRTSEPGQFYGPVFPPK